MKKKEENAITIVSLVVTIIILIFLAVIAIASLGGENGIFAKVKQAKKTHIESEMKEQLTMGLQELQVAKQGNATLDDVTQDWANEAILSDYSPVLQEDASLNGKLIIMTKDNVKGKFLIGQNLDIETIEYNTSSVEIEYTTISRIDNKVKINIVVTDKINGVKQIEYPEGNPLKVVSGTKEQISIDYEVELGQEYKFVITTGDGNKTEKIIKIDDYYYNVTKDFGESVTIDNNATKAAYNKTYEATISTEGNYAITSLVVTMGGKTITTSGNDIVDINTGKIKIEKVTDDINIKVTTKKLEIQYTAIAVSTSSSASNTSTLGANTQEKGKTLYINIIAKLEGNNCTVVLKADNSKTVPYAITSNGKYTFIVTGTYNGKTVEEEKEVIVNQYMSSQGVVSYDAGDWTEEEIQQLKNQNLYMINKEKIYNSTFNLDDKDTGLNFTFGGFTYKGDTANASDIESECITTNRNQSISCYLGRYERISFSGWQVFTQKTKKDTSGNTIKNADGSDRIYITKIVHAGSPENFVFYYTTAYDSWRAEYLLSGGKRQSQYSRLSNEKLIKSRSWQMYVDQNKKDLIADTIDKDGNIIKDIHVMDHDEATMGNKENNGKNGAYWYASVGNKNSSISSLYYNIGDDVNNCSYGGYGCFGIRPVITMADGVYIVSGSGTESDPYILGKD